MAAIPNYIRRITGLLFCLLVLLNLYGLPRASAGLISTQQEISLGANVAKQLESKYGLVDDPELAERVARIGARLVTVADRQDLKYSFKVLNAKEVNALAAPGGFIYIFKGLVDYMPSDDELAAVLGHELGHIDKRHSVKQIEKSWTVQLLFGLAFGDRGQVLQNLAMNAIMSGYSRKEEQEADLQGFKHIREAGFNPYSMLITMNKLNDLANKGSYGLFSTHPDPGSRVELVQKYMHSAKITPLVTGDKQAATVTDRNWNLPAFKASAGSELPLYRAYRTAGALYLAAAKPDFANDRFVANRTENEAVIYYGDEKIVTLSQQDVAGAGLTLEELTDEFLHKLREWSPSRGKNPG
ncbi:M48 family metallopeptidase [Sporomusa aerivorans]|uniref:M48 family metallopeptidase n=1 Tax=Sporomusa aerivorans TaxID=204936 RepID=UPI00352AABBE